MLSRSTHATRSGWRAGERVAAALRTLGGAGCWTRAGPRRRWRAWHDDRPPAISRRGRPRAGEHPENLDLKRELFTKLDSWCPPETILATNTSGLPITQIAEGLAGARRIIGVHYLNPAYLMPPVEVIPGEATAPEVVERMRAALIALGKSPLVVRREVPGFLWNRLQFALVREAFWLVQEGVATMEEVDLAIRQGLGRRWATAGLFASMDLGGLDTFNNVGSYLFPHLSNADTVPDFLRERIAAGCFGAKSGSGFYDWPDDKLAATVARRNAALLAALRDDRDVSRES
ncbi:MAG: 3-hydroxyacyl-CoA dehydrogenase NAD-binding domain-containing protein [Chloroflexia bacterium]